MAEHEPPLSGAFATAPPETERYTFLERLSAGGMGQVWRAHDRRLHRDVALKTVPIGASADVLARHLQEARIAAQIDVAGTVRVFDQGTLPDGRPFLVMELLKTPALGDALDRDLEVLVQAAEAVGEAHRLGFVHRDLKPSNLGLRGTRAVVLDWGLAKPIEPDSLWSQRVLTGAAPLTHTGMSLGTLGYMAPEQVSGGAVSARTDVWALGAMLHQVLTGNEPYAGGSHKLLADVTVNRLALPDHPVAPVVRRALSLDPALRQPNATVLAAELRQALAPRRSGWPWWVLAAGCAVTFALGWLLAPGADPSVEAVTEAGWLLAAQGRLAEAHRRGLDAEAIRGTPEGRGLLLLPRPVGAAVAPDPCSTFVREPGSPYNLCVEGEQLVLRRGSDELWRRRAPTRMWLQGDTVLVQEDWTLTALDPTGNPRWTNPLRSVDDLALVGDLLLRFHGESMSMARIEGTALVPLQNLPLKATLGVRTGEGVVVQADDALQWVDADGARVLVPFEEPLVAGFPQGTELWFVGLRGRVVRLDSDGTLLGDLRLRDATQVVDAAPLADGGLAVVTRRGLFVYRGSQVELQLSTDPALRLTVDAGSLEARGHGEVLRWPLSAENRWLMNPAEASTTAFGGRDPAFVAGREVFLFDPTTLRSNPRITLPSSPARSVLTPDFVVSNDQGFRLEGRSLVPLGPLPVLASLRSGTVVGARRFAAGIAWIRDDELSWDDTVTVRWLVPEFGGERVLGLDPEGVLVGIDEHEVTRLGPTGIDLVASGALGLALARGTQLELVDGFVVDVGRPISALAVDARFVVAGTLDGDLFVYDGAGVLQAHIEAHAERVSALVFHQGALFSGSWEPGVRRWPLDRLSP